MGTKMKGLYKGFKFISQIFVVKEREMEIGYPTDVKHVAHIGWDGQSGSAAPSWMKEFKTTSDFSTTSISNVGAPTDPNSIVVSTWSAQDNEQPKGRQLASGICRGSSQADRPKASKKHKRKKIKSAASSPKSSSSSMSRSYRASTKSKPSFAATVAEAETRSNLLTLVP